MEWDDFQDQVKNGTYLLSFLSRCLATEPDHFSIVSLTVFAGRGLITVAGVVHDVTNFIKDHPGGKAMIKSGLGKDATAM